MPRLRDLDHTLAIAMWDFTWLYRHYPYGAFEDWTRVLNELVLRGYNAVRIDAFPHLVAADPDGHHEEFFRVRTRHFGFIHWGTPWTIDVAPRAALIEFLRLCRERGVLVSLSTWMGPTLPERNLRLEGPIELARVWNETLSHIAEHDLLDAVIFVDLLNEYPDWHGFEWLHHQLKTMREPRPTGQPYNQRQKAFYRQVADETISLLRERWPQLDFTTSLTEWRHNADGDFTLHGAFDCHCWMVQGAEFDKDTGYHQHIHNSFDDSRFTEITELLTRRWHERNEEWEAWLDCEVRDMRQLADRWDIPFGNTEGWGPIFWLQHPSLPWNWVKEAGELAATLGVRHGMAFNCSSNFTHPHFNGMWDDVEYHQRVTEIIRSGVPSTTGRVGDMAK